MIDMAADSASADRVDGLVRSAVSEESMRRVAVFLSLIGREEAAAVLRRLPEEQTARILDVMSSLGTISPSDARRALSAFGAHAESALHEQVAGPETAREILVRAFGADEGERRFYEILPDERPRRFDYLADADGAQLAMVLRDESPEVITLIVAMMPESAAARLVEALPDEIRVRIVRRLAEVKTVDPDVLAMIEDKLRDKLSGLGADHTDAVDGAQRLADILRHLDLSSGGRILEQLEQDEPKLGKTVGELLSTFDDILRIPDRDLQRVLQNVDDVDLAVIIKGKKTELVTRILANVSERRAGLIELQRESLGPMRRGDVDRITADFLQLVRRMASAGDIVLPKPGETYVGLSAPERGIEETEEKR